jgi:hypothetical protein
VSRGVLKAAMVVSFVVAILNHFVLWMPLDSRIVTSGRFASADGYNTPIELKGRTFYVTVDEKSDYQVYMTTFFVCLTVVIVSAALSQLMNSRK